MDIMTDADLLAAVEAFLVRSNMKPSRFGREAMADPALVQQLRAGRRSLSLKNANKVLNFIEAQDSAPSQADAA